LIGFVQIAGKHSQGGGIAGVDGVRDLRDEFSADRAVLLAQWWRAGLLSGFPFSHARRLYARAPGLGK
jgi:hypothetical protein